MFKGNRKIGVVGVVVLLGLLVSLLVTTGGCALVVRAVEPDSPAVESPPPVVENADVEIDAPLTGDEISSVTAVVETPPEPEVSSEYSQHNPTYDEVVEFLTGNLTDRLRYQLGDYICSHFARDVNNAAEEQGIRCALIILRFPVRNHAIVAFETSDKGMVYFEPQTDEEVIPVIGRDFWRCIQPRPGYHYEAPDYDDKIVDIIVIW